MYYLMLFGFNDIIWNFYGYIYYYSVFIENVVNVGVDVLERDFLKEKLLFGMLLFE